MNRVGKASAAVQISSVPVGLCGSSSEFREERCLGAPPGGASSPSPSPGPGPSQAVCHAPGGWGWGWRVGHLRTL